MNSSSSTKIIELFGFPRTGKTTTARALIKYFSDKGYNVALIKERAGICPFSDKLHPFFNLWTTSSLIKSYVELFDRGKDLIIADRGVLDSLIWVESFEQNEYYEETKEILWNIYKSQLIQKTILCGYYFSADINKVLEREYGQLVKARTGRVVNKLILRKYKKAYNTVKKDIDVPILEIDTTNIILKTTIIEVVKSIEQKLEVQKWGHPLKGRSREKTPLHPKKYIFFFLSSHFRTSTASLYHLFSHPLFRSYRFRVSILLIRTSHPSGSRQLCFKRNA